MIVGPVVTGSISHQVACISSVLVWCGRVEAVVFQHLHSRATTVEASVEWVQMISAMVASHVRKPNQRAMVLLVTTKYADFPLPLCFFICTVSVLIVK